MQQVLPLFLILLACGTGHAEAAVTSIVNAASLRFRELPFSGIARGGLALARGEGFGPAEEIAVMIAVGDVSVAAQVISASETAVIFLVPADAPLGSGQCRIGASTAAPIEIVASNFGVYSMARNGMGQALAADADTGDAIVLAAAARPDQTVRIRGTGLGDGVGLEALLGARKAEIVSAGPAVDLPGIDDVVLRIPQDAAPGCYVPLYFRSDSVVSNVVMLPVAPEGGPCPDPFEGASPAVLKNPSVSLGAFVIDRIIDGPLNLNFGTLSFTRYESASYDSVLVLEPQTGTCVAIQSRFDGPGADPANPVGLDAGPSVDLTLAANRWRLSAMAPGSYFGELEPRSPIDFSGAATLSNGSGGVDIGSFRASVPISPLPPFQWPGQVVQTEVPREEPFTVKWLGGDADGAVTVAAVSVSGNVGVSVFCRAPGDASELTVPVDLLRLLPKSPAEQPGFISVEFRKSARISEPPAGVDDWLYQRRIRLPQTVKFR